MVIPITTYACELWLMSDEDIKLLEDFQVYSGRRVQGFHQSSPGKRVMQALDGLGLNYLCTLKSFSLLEI